MRFFMYISLTVVMIGANSTALAEVVGHAETTSQEEAPVLLGVPAYTRSAEETIFGKPQSEITKENNDQFVWMYTEALDKNLGVSVRCAPGTSDVSCYRMLREFFEILRDMTKAFGKEFKKSLVPTTGSIELGERHDGLDKPHGTLHINPHVNDPHSVIDLLKTEPGRFTPTM